MLDKILNSQWLFENAPLYVNRRQSQQNIDLIKTVIAIILRGYLDQRQIHSLLLTYDAKCAELGTGGEIPLQERAINECLRTIGLSIPRSFLLMWIKKCWQYLDCAMIEMHREKQNKNIQNNEKYKKFSKKDDPK